MVLSNKKLKQKLRTAAAETLTEGIDQLNPDANSQLKELLDTAKRKLKLSKREKRRKDVSLNRLDGVRKRSNGIISEESKNKLKDEKDNEDGVVGLVDSEENGERKGKKKKRKREELRGGGDVGVEEKEGSVKEASRETSKKKNKKKKKKKKMKKQEKKGERLDGAEEGTTEANDSAGSGR